MTGARGGQRRGRTGGRALRIGVATLASAGLAGAVALPASTHEDEAPTRVAETLRAFISARNAVLLDPPVAARAFDSPRADAVLLRRGTPELQQREACNRSALVRSRAVAGDGGTRYHDARTRIEIKRLAINGSSATVAFRTVDEFQFGASPEQSSGQVADWNARLKLAGTTWLLDSLTYDRSSPGVHSTLNEPLPGAIATAARCRAVQPT